GGQGTILQGINQHGVIAGLYIDAHGVLHGFIDRRGIFTTVNHSHAGTAPGQGTTLGSINDFGAVTGSYSDSHRNHFSFAGRPGHFTTVNDPAAPAFSTFAGGINDSGVITAAGDGAGRWPGSGPEEHE